jgi:hypothetical protein
VPPQAQLALRMSDLRNRRSFSYALSQGERGSTWVAFVSQGARSDATLLPSGPEPDVQELLSAAQAAAADARRLAENARRVEQIAGRLSQDSPAYQCVAPDLSPAEARHLTENAGHASPAHQSVEPDLQEAARLQDARRLIEESLHLASQGTASADAVEEEANSVAITSLYPE